LSWEHVTKAHVYAVVSRSDRRRRELMLASPVGEPSPGVTRREAMDLVHGRAQGEDGARSFGDRAGELGVRRPRAEQPNRPRSIPAALEGLLADPPSGESHLRRDRKLAPCAHRAGRACPAPTAVSLPAARCHLVGGETSTSVRLVTSDPMAVKSSRLVKSAPHSAHSFRGFNGFLLTGVRFVRMGPSWVESSPLLALDFPRQRTGANEVSDHLCG
jgi:hypothetical protein